MKKKYLFMSSFFIIGTIFTLVFYYSYGAGAACEFIDEIYRRGI